MELEEKVSQKQKCSCYMIILMNVKVCKNLMQFINIFVFINMFVWCVCVYVYMYVCMFFLGFGTMFGAQDLKDNMKKNEEIAVVEKYLMPHLDRCLWVN